MKKVYVKIYDKSKYLSDSRVVDEEAYLMESFEVKTLTPAEVAERGLEEVDPYDEYLILHLVSDFTATFRNSYVDLFYC